MSAPGGLLPVTIDLARGYNQAADAWRGGWQNQSNAMQHILQWVGDAQRAAIARGEPLTQDEVNNAALLAQGGMRYAEQQGGPKTGFDWSAYPEVSPTNLNPGDAVEYLKGRTPHDPNVVLPTTVKPGAATPGADAAAAHDPAYTQRFFGDLTTPPGPPTLGTLTGYEPVPGQPGVVRAKTGPVGYQQGTPGDLSAMQQIFFESNPDVAYQHILGQLYGGANQATPEAQAARSFYSKLYGQYQGQTAGANHPETSFVNYASKFFGQPVGGEDSAFTRYIHGLSAEEQGQNPNAYAPYRYVR
jgi:hypothetical protein